MLHYKQGPMTNAILEAQCVAMPAVMQNNLNEAVT